MKTGDESGLKATHWPIMSNIAKRNIFVDLFPEENWGWEWFKGPTRWQILSNIAKQNTFVSFLLMKKTGEESGLEAFITK